MVAANPEVLRLGYKILASERGIAAVFMPSAEYEKIALILPGGL
jgi:hypothetical protein